MSRRLLAALVLPLALTACSDDDPSGEADDSPTSAGDGPTAGGSTTGGADGSAGELSAADEAAIDETLKEFLVSGDCDLTTEDYLREIAILAGADASRDELCSSWEQTFSEPLYTKDDVLLTELEGADGVATVLVGSEFAPDVTILYELSEVDGTWLVSGDAISSEHLR
ncbi:MAG TPA: hypothetical protein VNS46_11795 [Nocardioides sp.]|nr:hypothetical protein [Nocardioides sp.]